MDNMKDINPRLIFHHSFITIYLFICLTKIKKEEMVEFTIMARRPKKTTRLIREATLAVINK